MNENEKTITPEEALAAVKTVYAVLHSNPIHPSAARVFVATEEVLTSLAQQLERQIKEIANKEIAKPE